MFKLKSLVLAIFFSVLLVSPVIAQNDNNFNNPTERSYIYKNISTDININADTTFDVQEKQTYSFTGEYHQGWRSIPHNKISNITNIVVLDGENSQPLVYSPSRLEKTLPSSWGKYTYFTQNNNTNIEWYYNAKDVDKTWILKYKISGGLAFNKANDQLYWNIFTGYQVPVQNALVNITLPQKNLAVNYFSYRTNFDKDGGATKNYDQNNGVITYVGTDFPAGSAFTIDLDWPRDVINRSAYWKYFLISNYGLIGGALILLISFLVILFYWLKTEVWVKGRGTIIPQYEPSKNLPPAMMQVVLTETTKQSAIPATIIDLAVRGFVKIEESGKNNSLNPRYKKIVKILGIIAIFSFLFPDFDLLFPSIKFPVFPIWIVFISFYFVVLIIYGIAKSVVGEKDFKVFCLNKNFAEDKNLNNYEVLLLEALFSKNKDYFSTKEAAKASNFEKRDLYNLIQKVKEKVLEETQTNTQAFDKPPAKEKYKFIILFIVVLLLATFNKVFAQISQIWFLLGGFILATVFVWVFVKFETKLNQSGRELKEEILGFKMFLYTAERYRLQNLTPDMFQKFLSYAMIFGIEKNWAAAFAGMEIKPPDWYHSTYTGAYVGGNAALANSPGNFSATAFSSSFASSFSSAFVSSGAGGAGGGGAGGGGGGGGGGAS